MKTIKKIAQQIRNNGGRAYFVGGFVRDKIMGLDSKDIDIEVFGISPSHLNDILEEFGEVKEVGKSFGVFKVKINGSEIDFSIPRTEQKKGTGHREFDICPNPNLTIEQAAQRRDFTFNAIYADVLTGKIFDYCNGLKHIKNKIIKNVSHQFGEDPLRVLRAMQFAGRFDFQIEASTCGICYDLKSEFETLPKERVWIEFEKLFSKSIKPSRGIEVLQQTGWIDFFPEISQMEGLPQDPAWHPEGDVLTHTKLVMDEAARLSNSPEKQVVNVMAALCHDMGKFVTTEIKDGRIISPKHAKKGVQIALSFMERINTPNKIKDKVCELVREHMAPVGEITKRTVRRLIHRMNHATIDELMIVIEADHSGRPPKPKGLPEKAKLIKELAQEIGDEIQPVLMGRHLISRGMKPGPNFGLILKQAEQAQLDGVFDELQGALLWLDNYEKVIQNGDVL
jgi:tRNA nucleotidyltransferase (CCA-adding enzyme)